MQLWQLQRRIVFILSELKSSQLFTGKIMDFYENKLVLITGGSSGLGLALARQLAARGANVWILARNPENLAKALPQIRSAQKSASQKFGAIQADVTKEAQITSELNKFVTSNGCPDILINSAGAAHPGMFIDMTSDVFRSMMDINYFGTVYTTQAVVPAMIKRQAGHIINISSMAGFMGVYGYTAYSGSKFAVRGFSDTLRSELKEHNVRISIVFPPDMNTPGFEEENKTKPPITRRFEEDNGGLVPPEDVARSVINAAARGKYIICPGFSTAVFYHAYHIFLNFSYTVIDALLDQARKKVEKQNAVH
jgi:3-dehydrosphinganine reductase